jgi:hypothetical protein
LSLSLNDPGQAHGNVIRALHCTLVHLGN